MQPEQLGPFRIGRVLGRGGMGAVYEGVHVETGEVAAVKVLLSTLQDDDELRQRFEAEIDTLKRLRHPNIVRLFGFGEEQGMLYYVMELVNGPSLHQETKRQRLFQWHEAAKIGLEMCLAFKHAHDRGITHRDIKPANILLEQQGLIKLSDFGIAHFFGGHRFTEANSVVGTLEYMSPEQALANPVGARSDLYSLGAVLYFLLVGRPPFTGRNLPEILRKHQNGVIASIRSARLDVPDELELIIFDLLKIHLEDRPHNAYLVVKRFQSLLQALVGPPERILVKPMDMDSPIAPSLELVHIPYKGDQDQSDHVLHPHGFIADTGVIDLGGIVDNVPMNEMDEYRDNIIEVVETQLIPTIELNHEESDKIASIEGGQSTGVAEKTSLADSFGRPSDQLNQTDQQTLEMSNPFAVDSKQAMTNSFSVSISPPDLPIGNDAITDRKSEHGKNRPDDIPSEIYGIKAERKAMEQAVKSLSGKFSFRSDIRHGEILFEDGLEIRRTKDEPIPDINVFEALQRDQISGIKEESEEKNEDAGKTVGVDLASFNTKNDNLSGNDEPTVDGLGTDHVPGRGLPPFPSNMERREPKELPESEPVSEKPVEPYGLQSRKPVSATVSEAKKKNSTIVDRPASSSHFTAVKDEVFNEFDSSEYRPMISLQTVLISLCLFLIGFTIYYLLQPVSADTLYERIKQTIDEGNDGDEIAPSALRRAEGDINSFLLEHAQHPMVDQVRFYQTELDLAKKEQELKRRQRLANTEITNPIEHAYIEATALAKTDPELAIIKLKAIIDVFRSENQPDTLETSKAERINKRQHLSPPELCVQLATRRLEKLEKSIETTKAEQLEKIQGRLDKADELELTRPERADEIRRGIIELYQNRHWAKKIVEEAQQKLKEPQVK